MPDLEVSSEPKCQPPAGLKEDHGARAVHESKYSLEAFFTFVAQSPGVEQLVDRGILGANELTTNRSMRARCSRSYAMQCSISCTTRLT